MENQLLTTKEVAKFLRVSETTIYRLVKRGELPAIKRGKGYTRFRKSQIEAFLDRYTTEAIPSKEDKQ